MFVPYQYAPRVAAQGSSQPAQKFVAKEPAKTTGLIRVAVPFEITEFPAVDWGDAPVTQDSFIMFPVDSAFDQLHIGWNMTESSVGYAAILTCQLMQASQDGAIVPILTEKLTFTGATASSRVLLESGLPIAANYPVFLRLIASASDSAGAAAANPSGPWFATSGLRLFGTLHLLQSEVT